VLATKSDAEKVIRGRRRDERRSVRKRWGKRCEEWRIIKGVRSGG